MRDAFYPITHSKNSGAFFCGALVPAVWPFSKQQRLATRFCSILYLLILYNNL